MSKSTIDKMLVELGHLPKNLATVVRESRLSKPKVVKNGHRNGTREDVELLTKDKFNDYVFECIAKHYQTQHPGTRLEAAMLYARHNFHEVADQMYEGYVARHHRLEEYAEVLKDTPKVD
jgi:hypothetical protein